MYKRKPRLISQSTWISEAVLWRERVPGQGHGVPCSRHFSSYYQVKFNELYPPPTITVIPFLHTRNHIFVTVQLLN